MRSKDDPSDGLILLPFLSKVSSIDNILTKLGPSKSL